MLCSYPSGSGPLIVLDAGEFRFHVCGATAASEPGDHVAFSGTLLLDHYAWVENLDSYPDPPDLFYNLRVVRIRRVKVPERFIARHDRGKSLPTRVGPVDFEDVGELPTMVGQAFDEEFYVVDFDSAGLEDAEIPRTFQ